MAADSTAELSTWLSERGISPEAPAFWLPRFRADWWRHSHHFPVVLPACTGRGVVESMHGIALKRVLLHGVERKTTWPSGADARELLFADERTRAWLAGQAPDPDFLVLTEGATDFLTASTAFTPNTYVIGYVSGSSGALRLVRIPRRTKVIAIMDPDRHGRKYEDEIVSALHPHPIRPTTLPRIGPWI